MSTVPTKLRATLADIFGVEAEEITAESGVNKLEGWDSFGHLQAILALESDDLHELVDLMRDLLGLREILELAAVDRAATRITDEYIHKLEHVHAGSPDSLRQVKISLVAGVAVQDDNRRVGTGPQRPKRS